MESSAGYFELAQAAIVCGEALLQRQYRREDRVWRREDRSWHQQDVSWRKEDREWRAEDLQYREQELDFIAQQKQWHTEEVQQRALDNARLLWERFVERNRRDVEERAEQLKSVSNSAAIIAGFALTAFLQFSFDPAAVHPVLLAAFSLTTALVVGLHSMAMITCSMMLASILRSGKEYVTEEEECKYMEACFRFIETYQQGQCPPAPKRNFAEHWNTRCESEWQFAFQLFSAGLVAFITNLITAAWIKFPDGVLSPTIVTATLAIALVGMLGSIYAWTGHLFLNKNAVARHQASYDLAAAAAPARGLPFDWHRVAPKGSYASSSASSSYSHARSRHSPSAMSDFRAGTTSATFADIRSQLPSYHDGLPSSMGSAYGLKSNPISARSPRRDEPARNQTGEHDADASPQAHAPQHPVMMRVDHPNSRSGTQHKQVQDPHWLPPSAPSAQVADGTSLYDPRNQHLTNHDTTSRLQAGTPYVHLSTAGSATERNESFQVG